jgi:hypothetical protein
MISMKGIEVLMKKLLVTILCLVILVSCRSHSTSSVQYNPNPENVKNPALVMKNIIEHQPPAYASMPTFIEVDDQCIKLYMGSGPVPIPIVGAHGGGVAVVPVPSSGSVSSEPICYKNIGKVSLAHNDYDKLWIVKIDDLNGNYMYWVYSFQKADAEQFMDAISNFVQLQKK